MNHSPWTNTADRPNFLLNSHGPVRIQLAHDQTKSAALRPLFADSFSVHLRSDTFKILSSNYQLIGSNEVYIF